MVLGMGSNFHLFPHGTSLHRIHYGEVSPMGMWHEKLIPGESYLWFPSKSYPREEGGVHWQVAHHSPMTDVNSMKQHNLPFILEMRTRERPGWISGCQGSQNICATNYLYDTRKLSCLSSCIDWRIRTQWPKTLSKTRIPLFTSDLCTFWGLEGNHSLRYIMMTDVAMRSHEMQ